MKYYSSDVENGNTNFYTLDKPLYSFMDMTNNQIEDRTNVKTSNGFKFTNYT